MWKKRTGRRRDLLLPVMHATSAALIGGAGAGLLNAFGDWFARREGQPLPPSHYYPGLTIGLAAALFAFVAAFAGWLVRRSRTEVERPTLVLRSELGADGFPVHTVVPTVPAARAPRGPGRGGASTRPEPVRPAAVTVSLRTPVREPR